MRQAKIFVILGQFFPFYLHPNDPKYQNVKHEKTPGDIFFHISTINDNHITYGSWYTERNGQNVLSFWTIFFTPLTIQEIKIWKNEKNAWIYYHFTDVYHNWKSYIYGSWDMEHVTDRIFCQFELFFCPFTPLTTWKNQNFENIKKQLGDSISLLMCTINQINMMYGSWDIKMKNWVFCHFGPFFCFFTTLISQKIKILKTWKNYLEILSLYTCAT